MLTADGLCKSYQGRQVLLPVSFSLEGGRCLGISGANGSGKSTLLRLLACVERPDSGALTLDGAPIDRRTLRRRVGYVPQQNALDEELTVREQLLLWQAACDLRGPLNAEVLALLGLEPLLGRPLRQLSVGMQRRVSIAMALLPAPDVLLMDEATAGLDGSYAEALLSRLRSFLRQGGHLVWCTHHPSELDGLPGPRLRLTEGRAELN